MNASFPSLRLGSFTALLALLLVVVSTGCGSLMQRTASLEDDELYLDRGEEFITDAEYLAYAYEQAGYDPRGEYGELDSRGGDAFQSSFGYVPQSLRGRSMLRGYMTPYGAAGFGPNPYDPWGSSFYGGYNPYSPYGGSMGYNMIGGNGWGMNPYMGNNWGMNPYAYNPYGYGHNGYNPYGYGGYGLGGYGTGGYSGFNNWGNSGWGSDVFEVSNVVVAPRTPIWSSTSINSNAGGGRLLTNKVEESSEAGEPAAPRTIWRGMDTQGTSTRSSSSAPSRTNTYGNTPSRTTPTSNSRSSWGSSGSSTRSSSSTRSTTTRSSSSSRNSSWSGSSSGSSRSSGSSTRSSSSSGSSRGSSGSSTGRSNGSSRNSGRGGGQPSR